MFVYVFIPPYLFTCRLLQPFEKMGFKFINQLITRKRNIFSLLGAAVVNMSSKSDSSGSNLTLYFNHHSFYSRKVWMTLEEKRVKYQLKTVEIVLSEQYQPWYLAMSPRGEVPVLKDGETVIADSKNIIDYLEDNFSYGNYPSLMGKNLDTETRSTISEFRKLIDSIEGNLLGFGLLFHEEYTNPADMRFPFILPGIPSMLKREALHKPENLRKLAESLPDCKDVLLEKAKFAEKTREIATSKELFAKEVENLHALLSVLEEQLSKQANEDGWLCCDQFTQADVSLTLLLERIWKQGAGEHFLGRRPRLQRYLERVINREAFKRIQPTIFDDWRVLWPLVAGTLLVLTLIVIGVVMIVVK